MSDLLLELGALSLGSRLKRLSDGLMQDGARIYEELGAGFEPRWFPVFAYLHRYGPTSITGLARGLGVSHPGINKIANELIEARLVAPYKDRKDKRKRVLALTSAGRDKFQRLEPEWRKIRQALQSAIDEQGGDFLKQLEALETSFNRLSFFDRYQAQNGQSPNISIEPYQSAYAAAFRSLNLDWISHFFEVEVADRKALDNPAEILERGGAILFAVEAANTPQEKVVLGTCALVRHSATRFELAKMAVQKKAKGKRIGEQLGLAIIDSARSAGAKELFLESNTKLAPAINLYKKLGFIEAPFPHPSDYQRANIYMSLGLS